MASEWSSGSLRGLPAGPAGIATDSDEEMVQQHCLGDDEAFNDAVESFENIDVAYDNVCARPGG